MASVGSGVQLLNVTFTEKFSERITKSIFLRFPRYQTAVAETLNIPSNRVSCHVKRIGGAFGGKVTKTSILACIASVAACKCVFSLGSPFTPGERGQKKPEKTLCASSQNRSRGALCPGAWRGHADHRSSPPRSGQIQGAAPCFILV